MDMSIALPSRRGLAKRCVDTRPMRSDPATIMLLSSNAGTVSEFATVLPGTSTKDCNGRPIAVRYCINPDLGAASLSVSHLPRSNRPPDRGEFILVVDSGMLHAVFGWAPANAVSCHIPTAIRRVLAEIGYSPFGGRSATCYFAAKIAELLCLTADANDKGELVRVIPGKSLSMNDCKRLMIVHQLVEERFHEQWTLDGLARAAGLNRCTLVSGYRDLFNRPVIDAIRARRLEAAREDLMTSDRPVSQICHDIGYESAASFSRAFRRQFGVSPSAIRQTMAT